MVLTDADGRLLFCSPAQLANCADITHARQLGLVKYLNGGPAVEILADAGYTKRSTRAGARHTLHAGSGSSTASHTSRTGGHPPATTVDAST
ncbi:hypothetical protein [Streptomyces sp. NPDC092307]|uniref:hypothetical protein n=1 Tax=Streptomyces sp. NPDC092307 TaxID=3366013 RepID=UPI0037F6CEA6